MRNINIETLAFIAFSSLLFLFYIRTSSLVTPNEYMFKTLKSILYVKTDYFIFLLVLPLIFSYLKNKEIRELMVWTSLILSCSYFILISIAVGNFSIFMLLLCFLMFALAINYKKEYGLLIAIFLPLFGFFFTVLYFVCLTIGSVKYLSVLYFYMLDFYVFATFILFLGYNYRSLFLKYSKYIFFAVFIFSLCMFILDPFLKILISLNKDANSLVFYMRNAKSVKEIFTNDYLIKFYGNLYNVRIEKPHKNMAPFSVCINNIVFNNSPDCLKNSRKLLSRGYYDIYLVSYVNKSFCQLS